MYLLYFQVCDWPEAAGCVSGKPPGDCGRDKPSTSLCPKDETDKNATLLAHECVCSKFYYCEHGGLTEFDCPKGLHFNDNLKVILITFHKEYRFQLDDF